MEGIVIPSYIPYLFLVLASILLFTLSWRKADNKALIPFYLYLTGIIYLFEYAVLVLFQGYVYLPGVFKNDYFDNVLGANISNGFIVPAVTVFISVFDLGLWWVALFTAGFLGIEELFLHLGVYRHIWWKTAFTGISLPVHFLLGKWIWHKIRFHIHLFFLRVAVLYFANLAIQGSIMFYMAAVFHLFIFHVSWFDDPIRGHIAFITLYFFIDSIFFSLAVALKVRWFWYTLLIAGITGVNVLLYKLGMLEITAYWEFGLLAFIQTGGLLLLIYMGRILTTETN